jgi:excisionase family DNA binding protein
MQSIKQLARADELAQRLSCGKSTVYQLTKAGKIPFVAIGLDGLERLLAQAKQKAR